MGGSPGISCSLAATALLSDVWAAWEEEERGGEANVLRLHHGTGICSQHKVTSEPVRAYQRIFIAIVFL